MKNIIYFFSILLIGIGMSSCTSSKELSGLKTDNTSLKSQVTKLESNIADLNAQKAKNMAEMETNAKKVQSLTSEKMKCESDLAGIAAQYDLYKLKLTKMKTELKAAFPNNLNETNFSIVEEDGRLVITLPNKILYKTGEANFDAMALEVIQKLAKVFRNNQGLQILVEGHTDEVPLRAGSKYADNWDLSLARAVNIVRQLETYGVFPARLTAAGRGYFAPKNRMDSDEARAMNRRTEIIIRPNSVELMSLIDNID